MTLRDEIVETIERTNWQTGARLLRGEKLGALERSTIMASAILALVRENLLSDAAVEAAAVVLYDGWCDGRSALTPAWAEAKNKHAFLVEGRAALTAALDAAEASHD